MRSFVQKISHCELPAGASLLFASQYGSNARILPTQHPPSERVLSPAQLEDPVGLARSLIGEWNSPKPMAITVVQLRSGEGFGSPAVEVHPAGYQPEIMTDYDDYEYFCTLGLLSYDCADILKVR